MKSEHRGKSKSSRVIGPLLFLAVFAAGLGGGYWLGYTCDQTHSEVEQALVTKVIDGDTIQLANGDVVRYLGIDTPESGEFYFNEATNKNRELVEGKLVKLERGTRERDEYGRLLRYVFVDGTFVNAELVAQGYARAYIFDPDDWRSQVLVQLEQYAKLRKRGLWNQ